MITKPVALLRVARDRFHDDPFTVWDLAVKAAHDYPALFSMKGYPGQASDNTVKTYLVGSKGLTAKGHLEHVAENTYRLTRSGRLAAEADVVRASSPSLPWVGRSTASWLASRASWARAHSPVDCSLKQAGVFWGGLTRGAVEKFAARLEPLDWSEDVRLVRNSHRVLYLRFASIMNLPEV